MKNYQPNYLSMLLLMFVCIASCSNETTSGPGFEIGGTPAESVYQIPSDRCREPDSRPATSSG